MTPRCTIGNRKRKAKPRLSGLVTGIGVPHHLLAAIGYCATLWIMGRRDAVIYGQFIREQQ